MELTKVTTQIQIVLLIGIVVTLPFLIVPNSVLIILITINSFVIYFTDKERLQISRKLLFRILLFASPFLLYLFAFTVSAQLDNWYILEKKFSILIFPIVFGITANKLETKHINWMLVAFVVSTLLAALNTFNGNLDLIFGIKPEDNIDSFLILRRPYFGLYAMFGVLILFHFLIVNNNSFYKFLSLLLAGFFLYFAYLIYAKMAMLSFGVTVCCLLVVFISVSQIKKVKWFLFLIPTLLFLIAFINPTLQTILYKIIRFEPFDFSEYQWIYFLSLNMRFAIWDCVWSVLSHGSNWFWGCGLDHQYLLDQCYYSSDTIWVKYGILPELQEHFPYNAHNEFFQVWLDLGIIGLLLFVLLISESLKIAVKENKFLYLAFLILFFFSCITESMFSVQKGIVFYTFFNSLFAFSNFKSKIN